MNALSPDETRTVAEVSTLLQRRPRLLVVDDQPVNVQALYQAFSADYQVFMATSGEQALSLCASRHPALKLARRIGQQVFDQQIEHADSSAAPVVTVSLGVCSTSKGVSGTALALLREADAQLYKAKANGRHQACGTEMRAFEAERGDGSMIESMYPVPPVTFPQTAYTEFSVQ